MTSIKKINNTIVLENDRVEIVLAKNDSLVEKVIDKKTGKDIRGEETKFFSFLTREKEETAKVSGLSLNGDIIRIETDKGAFDIKALAFDNYFSFEVVSKMPEGIYQMHFAHIKYDYDYVDKKNTGAVIIPMTIWADPVHYPDAKQKETYARVLPHLGDVEAKIALIIAPIIEQGDIIKEASLTIDRNKGIVSKTGGAWGRDSRLNFSDYTIVTESSSEYIQDNIEYFKSIGVDQIDFHKFPYTFRQGDFKFYRYKDGAEFKKNVSDVLEANGMTAGLHTYSFYINYDVETILSKPENLRQIKVMGEYTLAEDITEDFTGLFAIEEDFKTIPTDRGFCKNNSPFFLMDDELVEFVITPEGLKITGRGKAESKISTHKKGSIIKHLEGHYNGLTPVLGSDLFLEIARLTAKAYNEGGFKMIYLDALDGLHHHCDRGEEDFFYLAQFVCEVLKNCKVDPVMEAATFMPSMWACRGRIGAWDTPYRGYRNWNLRHVKSNLDFVDRYQAPILGWYDYYPTTDKYPANEHTKYHHTDSMHHLGSLALMYDFANVFNGTKKENVARIAGLKRNIEIYKKYDDLRKAQYFSADYRQKLIDGKHEYHLKEKRGGKWIFVEKDYQFAKLFDLKDSARNVGHFKNPFGQQVPFVRIEAMHSTLYQNPMVMMKLDENADLITQKLSVRYGCEINFSDNLAKVVKVKGNGIKGGKIAIKTRCATNSEIGYGEYIIDTDFDGWREFILIESDNGERNDHNFEDKEWLYGIFRSSLNHDRMIGVDIETEGDMTGVKMSSIIAYEHVHEAYKNPTLRLGDTWIVFECELLSGEFIEWDGTTAKAIDRFGNERPIWFNNDGKFKAPRGKFNVSVEAKALNRTTPRMQLTLGFTGKEVK
ncbi:MAG: hypothetical protein E7613_09970 [Ruminococcaceae bacterium]|nr:hypothetical protein [Oscillospiraceae bacterium]